MSDFVDPRKVLDRYGLRAKKSWGQNFLVDLRVHDAIVAAAVRAPDEWLVEIGAGLGTLTTRLAAALPEGRLLAVERDRDMVRVLRGELGEVANVEILEANALALDYAELAARAGRKLAVCGNLPYQISSPLLFHVVEAREHVSRAVVMLQREVAERLLAPPDTREYGALGAMIGAYATVRRVIRASAGAFHPQPKVESVVVELTPIAPGQGPVTPSEEARYSRVVHAAFGQRRKTLRNALRSALGPELADGILAATGTDGGRRGETLSVLELAALARALPVDLPADRS